MDAEADRWHAAGEALTRDGDARLAEDDFEGACRHYLVAAWCFGRAAVAARDSDGDRHVSWASYRYALEAAAPLVPDGPPAGSHSSRSVTGSRETPRRSPERHSRS